MALVLLVDDEFAIAELLQAMVEEEGHEVATAQEGEAGLASMRERRPALVFTDTMMPGLGGPEMVRAMRLDPALAAIPVVAMSAYPEASVGSRYPGYAAFLLKPFRVGEVAELLARFLPPGR